MDPRPGTTAPDADGTEGSLPPVDEGHGPHPPRLRLEPWSVVRAVVLVGVWVAALYLVRAADTALWWVAIAAAIAGLLLPAVQVVRRWIPGWAALVVVLVVVGVGGGLLLWRVLVEINAEVEVLRDRTVEAAASLERSDQYGEVATEFGLSDKVDGFFFDLPVVLGGGDTATVVNVVTENAGAVSAIFFLTLLFVLSGRRAALASIEQIEDPRVARRVRRLTARAYRRAGGYAWSMLAWALAVGVVVFVVASVAGLPAPTAMAAWFAAWSLLPGLGLVVAVVPLALGLLTVSGPAAVAALALAVVGQALAAQVVQQRIDARTIRFGPLLTLVAVVVGAQLRGFGGVLVAMAVAVFAVAVLSELGRSGTDLLGALRGLVSTDGAGGQAAPESAEPAPSVGSGG